MQILIRKFNFIYNSVCAWWEMFLTAWTFRTRLWAKGISIDVTPFSKQYPKALSGNIWLTLLGKPLQKPFWNYPGYLFGAIKRSGCIPHKSVFNVGIKLAKISVLTLSLEALHYALCQDLLPGSPPFRLGSFCFPSYLVNSQKRSL